MFVGLSHCHRHTGLKSFNFNLHVSVSDQMLNANCGSVLLGNNFLVLFFFCRKDLILQLWEQLLELLKRRRSRLEKSMKLQRCFQEMINTIDWMDEIKVFVQIVTESDCGWLFFYFNEWFGVCFLYVILQNFFAIADGPFV